jgi:hypothetical protein
MFSPSPESALALTFSSLAVTRIVEPFTVSEELEELDSGCVVTTVFVVLPCELATPMLK